ncbi:hypothetical protein N9T65_00550 [Candidatus Pelagibacter sp.]|nr:hypothetical protein [Candidatus Pelagibacter sp.]MDA9663350.1 hypothetical protein [Candidatus Pelagibacter sp.]
MATINLGAIKFNWKGPYNNSTAYVVDDVVSSGGSSYVCILASQGNAVSSGTYWQIMSSAGTNGSNGTDLTSTLSTRGDLVFKGASALTRLPKGTAGYVLKQGANDPEWAAAASGGAISTSTAQRTTYFSTTTADSWVSFGAGASVTPASTSSKFLVMFNSFVGTSSHSSAVAMKFTRAISGGATTSLVGSTAVNGSSVQCLWHGGEEFIEQGSSQYYGVGVAFWYLDAPNTTSAVTYDPQLWNGHSGSTVALGIVTANGNSNEYPACQIKTTVIEI